jgi:hypothetical protein
VVDEAHQEDKLLDNLRQLPHRSMIMLTGTPVVSKVELLLHVVKCESIQVA